MNTNRWIAMFPSGRLLFRMAVAAPARAESNRKMGRSSTAAGPTRLNQQQLDESCHRLSRVTPKYADPPRPGRAEGSQSFALDFFQSNPDTPIDKRTPADKLEEIETRLQGDLDDQNRFNLLAQRKSLCFLAFGENSPESVRALCALGDFYNQQSRPESALRHLGKAKAITDSVELSERDQLAIAVEAAAAHLMMGGGKHELRANARTAEAEISPFARTEVDDLELIYKRDLAVARIHSRLQRIPDAFQCYDKAVQTLSSITDAAPNPETANLYLEIAELAEKATDNRRAGAMYHLAHQIFERLGMEEAAQRIKPKLQQYPPHNELLIDVEDAAEPRHQTGQAPDAQVDSA
jgi:tetratricopeptide (TPR) repeat protein